MKLIIAILICYRLAYLLTLENGPFHIFERLRAWAGKQAAQAQGDNPGREASHVSVAVLLAEVLSCPLCAGVWIALALSPLFFGWQFWIYWLAIAGGQLFLHKIGVIMSVLAQENNPEE